MFKYPPVKSYPLKLTIDLNNICVYIPLVVKIQIAIYKILLNQYFDLNS